MTEADIVILIGQYCYKIGQMTNELLAFQFHKLLLILLSVLKFLKGNVRLKI